MSEAELKQMAEAAAVELCRGQAFGDVVRHPAGDDLRSRYRYSVSGEVNLIDLIRAAMTARQAQ